MYFEQCLKLHVYTATERGKGTNYNILLQVRQFKLHIDNNNGGF